MAPQQGLQWDGFRLAGARVKQPLLGKVEVFEVVQVAPCVFHAMPDTIPC